MTRLENFKRIWKDVIDLYFIAKRYKSQRSNGWYKKDIHDLGKSIPRWIKIRGNKAKKLFICFSLQAKENKYNWGNQNKGTSLPAFDVPKKVIQSRLSNEKCFKIDYSLWRY